MSISELLMDDAESARVSLSNGRWLTRDERGMYFVYERQPHGKKTLMLVCTGNESEAVAMLLGNQE